MHFALKITARGALDGIAPLQGRFPPPGPGGVMDVDVEPGRALGLINPRQGPNLPGGPAADSPLVLQSILVSADSAGPVKVTVVDADGILAFGLLSFDGPGSLFSDRRWIIPAGYQIKITGPAATTKHVIRLSLWQFTDQNEATALSGVPVDLGPGGDDDDIDDDDDDDEPSDGWTLPTTPDPGGPGQKFIYSLQLPEGVSLNDVIFHAAGGDLRIDDAVSVTDGLGGYAPLFNMGSGLTQINANAKVGSVTSVGNVTLNSGSHVYGFVRTEGTLTEQAGVVVDGTKDALVAIPRSAVFTESMTFPLTNSGDRFTDANLSLPPGAYGRVSVRNGFTLTLQRGVYLLEHFEVEPTGHVLIDNATGPVLVFVRQSMFWRAASQTFTGSEANFKITYFGSSLAPFDRSFSGIVVAPNAKLDLNAGTGTNRFWVKFFGFSVEAFPGGSQFERLGLVPPPAGTAPSGPALSDGFDYVPQPEGPVTGSATTTAEAQYLGSSYVVPRRVEFNRLLVRSASSITTPTPPSGRILIYQSPNGTTAQNVELKGTFEFTLTGTPNQLFELTPSEGLVSLEAGVFWVLWGQSDQGSGSFTMVTYAVAAVPLLNAAGTVPGTTHPTQFRSVLSATSRPASFRPLEADETDAVTSPATPLAVRIRKV